MTRWIRPATAGVAFLLTCAAVGATDTAYAASTKTHTKLATHSHASHTHASSHKPVDKLAGVRKGATKALAAGTARVNRVAAAEAASPVLSADEKSALGAATTADLAALTADATAVSQVTSAKAIQAAVHAGLLTVQGADLQFKVMTAAAKLDAAADSLATDAAAVGARTDAMAVPAAPSATELQAARSAAHEALDVAEPLLEAAEQDLSTATAALAALQAPAP